MNYSETIEYLYGLLPMFQRVGAAAYKPSLDNTIKLLSALGDPHKSYKCIHVAGTNGKGSSSHMLAAILQSSGYKTGLYTSPHLKDFRERIKIDGHMITQDFIVDFIANHRDLVEDLKPSFFEMTVALAFDYFKSQQVDWAVIEVGMGGRLDSTNVILPEISLITQIGFDHMEFLGDTLAKIAFEKAGIIKSGIPVIISEKQTETTNVFVNKAMEMSAQLTFADQAVSVVDRGIENGIRNIQLHSTDKHWDINLDLLGNYQLKNIKGVWLTIESLIDAGKLTIDYPKAVQALSLVSNLTGLKGRWQVLSQSPWIICDTAHNEAGVKEIIQQMNSYSFDQLHVVWGMVGDKPTDKILSLLPRSAKYYFTQPSIPRALPVDQLKQQCSNYGLTGSIYSTVNEAFKSAYSNSGLQDFIYIGGSTFVVADFDETLVK